MPHTKNNPVLAPASYPSLQHYTGTGRFSWTAEWKHLLSPNLFKAGWWPLFRISQQRLHRQPVFRDCMRLPGFPDLWKTIQKGSFAYNHLFLGLSPLRHARRLQVADITTVALFFGDEFIDGVASAAGKKFVKALIGNNPEQFTMRVKKTGTSYRLCYLFDMEKLLPAAVLEQVNEKYRVSYRHLYRLLTGFLELLNAELARMPRELAGKTAAKIASACNTCYYSFVHDNYSEAPVVTPALPREVMYFHEQKTAFMQARLLELRCVLAEKEEAMNCIHMPGWLDIMRVIQIYDDIHDAVLDYRVQDNLLLSVAFHQYPTEWEWFCRHARQEEWKKECRVLLSRYMPASMHYCFQLAAEKILRMNWEQQKIMHYLVFRNNYSLHFESPDDSRIKPEIFLAGFYRQVRHRLQQLSSEQIKSFIVDTYMHVPGTRKKILRRLSLSSAYQLRYNLFSLPPSSKAAIFDKLAV